MSSLDTAYGFVGGFKGALADAQKTRQASEDRAYELQQRANNARLATKTEARNDIDWGLNHAMTQEKFDQYHQQLAHQAQQEGLTTLIDSVNAGADPRQIEQEMNSQGQWKIQPGSLQYDNTPGPDRRVTFTGAGGQQFNGTLGQLQALFGQPTNKKDLIAVAPGASLYNPNTNSPVFTNPKPSDGSKQYLTAGKNQRVYQLDANGQVVRDANGNPKMVIAAEPGSEDGDRKIAPYNPEGHAQQAVQAMNTGFKTHWDAQKQSFVLDNPDDSERQLYGADLITSFMAKKGLDGQNYGAGEIADAAHKAASAKLTLQEAQAKVKKAGYAEGSPAYNQQVAKLIKNSDIRASQIWNSEISSIEAKHKNDTPASKSGAANSDKPSLDDIFGQ